MAGVAITLLDNIVGWDSTKIHIATIPDGWLNKISAVEQQIVADADAIAAQNQAYQGAATGGFLGSSSSMYGTSPLNGYTSTVTGIGAGTGAERSPDA